MNDFIQGFLQGARETPRAFFAPMIAVWRLLLGTTNSLLKPKKGDDGELTPAQLESIRKAEPQGRAKSVKSSLF